MKKILIALVIIFLSSILIFQYKNYKKYNPPSYFNYTTNDSIDINYYDPIIVQHYFENTYQLGSFARQLWFNKGIDINFLDESKDNSRDALNYYKTLIATTHILERKLIKSYKLKETGFANNEIKRIIETGTSAAEIHYQQAIESALYLNNLRMGDTGQDVWALQKLLIAKGYDIPKDGNFGNETQNAIIDFQKGKDLYSSGAIDIATIKELVK